jgi:hypothetical protein
VSELLIGVPQRAAKRDGALSIRGTPGLLWRRPEADGAFVEYCRRPLMMVSSTLDDDITFAVAAVRLHDGVGDRRQGE